MSCAILAHERETLDKIFQIVKRAYDNIPPRLKPKTKTDTIRTYRFESGFDGRKLDSEIYVALKLRGGTVYRLHITEAAYIKNRQELKTGSLQAVPKDGYVTEETTGNGMGEFYDDYNDSLEKLNSNRLGSLDYMPYFYGWFENPEYTLPGIMPEVTPNDLVRYGNEAEIRQKYNLSDGQLLWRRWKIDEMRGNTEGVGLNHLQKFMQEYPATILEAFQSGAGNVFDLTKLMALEPRKPLDPLAAYKILTEYWDQKSAQEQEDGKENIALFNRFHKMGVKIWYPPVKSKTYVVGVDPSDGEGSDFTCIDIWEIGKEMGSKKIQVAQFYVKIRPDQGAEVCRDLCNWYNKAFVGVENNMLSFILFLSKIYDNYYTKVDMDKKTNKRTLTLGWNTNSKTRDILIDDYIANFEDDALEINSNITINEMKTFVKKENGKREHADGKHDDSLFGGMIALQMKNHEPAKGRVFYKKPAGL